MDELSQYILFLIVIVLFFIIFVIVYNKSKLNKARNEVQRILTEADLEANKIKKEKLLEAKEEIHQLKLVAERDIKDRKAEISRHEDKLDNREKLLNDRDNIMNKREDNLDKKEQSVSDRMKNVAAKEQEAETKIEEQVTMLQKIANYSVDDAKLEVIKRTEEMMEHEIATIIREKEEDAKAVSDRKAKELLALAMQKYASEQSNEICVSSVTIPSEDIKGRIIGREGRNIRTFEALTGVDLIIDDTPDTVVLSGFDPVRREIARISLEKLIKEGRINPTRIEEIVSSVQKEINQFIFDKGEETVFELGIVKPHRDIIKYIGRLHFRTSYGQNALLHSKEVAFLSGILAAEIGEDPRLAKRAGLLHDIGKAVDHEAEGSHVDLGLDLARRYNEHEVVYNSIGSHHGNIPPSSNISICVAAADALSASRPGARSDSLENYIRRLEQLEELASKREGVDRCFALQAGREVRIIVNPQVITDSRAIILAREIKKDIEDNLQYPGTIKVTVIRETRASVEAK